MTDFYIENPAELKGQPKRTIADYVESKGILVPKRFESLEEAQKSEKEKVFLRSEHEQEYAGCSGLLNSLEFYFDSTNSPLNPYKDVKSLEEFKEIYFKKEDTDNKRPYYKRYCKFLGKDAEKFKQEVTFSIWQHLGGTNRMVVADSAIENRYHIISFNRNYEGPHARIMNYAIVENGSIVKSYYNKLPEEFVLGLPKLIEMYETIRKLERFDPQNCPIMEFQTELNKDYFLQYHIGTDFDPSDFILERECKDGEIEVPFVRGKTSKEGNTFKIAFFYGEDFKGGLKLLEAEEGSYDNHCDYIFTELMVRRRQVQIYDQKYFTHAIGKVIDEHVTRSRMFKPKISIIMNSTPLVGKDEWDIARVAAREGTTAYLDLHITSDGRKAYVERL